MRVYLFIYLFIFIFFFNVGCFISCCFRYVAENLPSVLARRLTEHKSVAEAFTAAYDELDVGYANAFTAACTSHGTTITAVRP